MADKIRILVVNGSPRNGMVEALAKEVMAGVQQEKGEVATMRLSECAFPVFTDWDNPPVGVQEMLEQVVKFDGMVCVTPTHWYNMSGLMKNFIDWLSCLEFKNFALEGKVLGVVASCEEDGGQLALNAMMNPLLGMGMILAPWAAVYHNRNMAQQSEEGWQFKDLHLLGRNVVRLARALSGRTWGYEK